MHKATGWMLREAGKRDMEALRRFLGRWTPELPRTTLRYAIERMDAGERRQWMAVPRRAAARRGKSRA
jgi:3-methyladenine DNA glycosylase AlkD